MAKEEKKDNRTQDEIREANMTFSQDEIDEGLKLIKDQGYITKKDMKQMNDFVWATAFAKKLDKELHSEDEDPYMYAEQFDFKGGAIEGIIFNMDVIKSRDAALKKLAEVTNQTI